MCGFAGYIHNYGTFDKEEVIHKMADRIKHRGPDDAHYYIDDGIALGFRRLSIIDLEGGRQPILNEDGSLVLLFNGEIYNYQELREELIKAGHVFTTKTDSETILHGYEEYGKKILDRLRGMFAFIIWNKNQHSADYDNMKNVYRPSHADYTYQTKYGIRDPRGGGRSSARETIARCVAGAIAKLVLRQKGIRIQAFTSQVGNIKLNGSYTDYDLDKAEDTAVRCPDPATAEKMEALIAEVKSKGDTIGGVITCVAQGVPIGLGEPVFGKLHAALGHAMLTINAVKGFEYGDGFEAALYRGSERNDRFFNDNGHINTHTNHSGGIQGGISNGQDIYFRVAFKSVATILMEQETVNIDGIDTTLKARGRHDACVLPRAVPIVEAMAAMTILDYYLLDKTTQL